jgi:hypothetical protein
MYFILLIHLYFCCFQLFPQENRIKKEKIYTLTQDEVVAQEENSLGLYQDELGYIVVTADVKKFTRNYHIQGKKYGPFDRRLVEKPTFNLNTWGFIDSRGDTSVVLFNGKELAKYIMPEYPMTLKIAKKTYAFALVNQTEGTDRVIINGKTYGPYFDIVDYYLSNDGLRWAVAYAEKPEEYYIVLSSGRKMGPYRAIHGFAFIEGTGDKWVLLAEQKDSKSIIRNGQEINTFSVLTHNGHIGTFEQEKSNLPEFDFKNLIQKGLNYGLNVVKDDKFFFLANDKLFGPYSQPVESIDMGEDYNKFNYIDKTTKNLHFTGDGIFSRRVDKYHVSESRKTILIIKNAGANKDSLFVNDKYFKGVYNKIVGVKFAPKGEEWAIMTENPDKTLSIHFSDQRTFGPFKSDAAQTPPHLILGQGAKHWAFYYSEGGNLRLLLDNRYEEGEKINFLGTMTIAKEDKKEYFSWFTLEDKTVYLNKLVLE